MSLFEEKMLSWLDELEQTVPSQPSSWSSGCNTDDVPDDMRLVDWERFCFMASLGAVLYDACLRGPDTIKALAPEAVFDRAVPGEEGDNVFQFVLRTGADQFDGEKSDTIAYLLRHGAAPLARDRLGDTALHSLVSDKSNNLSLFLDDLETPEHVRYSCISQINCQNDYGNTPIVNAVLYDNVEAARKLLAHGADPWIAGEFGMDAFEFANLLGNDAMFGLLLDYSTCSDALDCSK